MQMERVKGCALYNMDNPPQVRDKEEIQFLNHDAALKAQENYGGEIRRCYIYKQKGV